MIRSRTIPRQRAPDSLESRGDAELVKACVGGDEDAWRELVVRYGRLVRSIPRSYGLPEADCDDVFQDVFAALVRQLAHLRDAQSLAKWLIITTHRTAWRRLAARDALPVDAELAGDAVPPPMLAERWERQHLVRSAVRQLGGRCRRLLEALYLGPEQPSYDVISRRLGIPRGSIGPTRARCLAKLLQILRARTDGPFS